MSAKALEPLGEEIQVPAVFLSCLGTNDYEELSYAPHAGESSEIGTFGSRFIQVARLNALAQRGIELSGAFILVTDRAREKNWQALKDELQTLHLEAEMVEIPSGATEDDFWTIFGKVAGLIPEKSDIYVDLTHGFRSLPVLVLVALEYVEKVKEARIRELTYGARIDSSECAPTWNLEPFLVLRRWASALTSFLEDGDTRPLAREAREPIAGLTQVLRREMPPELRVLPNAFDAFGEAMLKCHAPSVGKLGAALGVACGRARDAVAAHSFLQPLGLVLSRVQEKLRGFPEDWQTPKGNLRSQRAAVEWCLEHGLAMQALTFLREAFVTALSELSESGSKQKRTEQDRLLGAMTVPGSLDQSWASEQVRAWRESPPLDSGRWKQLISSLSRLKEFRNRLDHAHTKPNDGDKPLRDQEWIGEAREILRCLDWLIDTQPGRGRKMLVVLSHSLTADQKLDARDNWGVADIESAPAGILEQWSNLDPAVDLPASLVGEISAWLGQNAEPGDLLLVQGELGMSWMVANDAREQGLVPVYAVTRREASDAPGTEGVVTRTSIFKHVRYREYPFCAGWRN